MTFFLLKQLHFTFKLKVLDQKAQKVTLNFLFHNVPVNRSRRSLAFSSWQCRNNDLPFEKRWRWRGHYFSRRGEASKLELCVCPSVGTWRACFDRAFRLKKCGRFKERSGHLLSPRIRRYWRPRYLFFLTFHHTAEECLIIQLPPLVFLISYLILFIIGKLFHWNQLITTLSLQEFYHHPYLQWSNHVFLFNRFSNTMVMNGTMELKLHSPAGQEPCVYKWPLTSGRGAVWNKLTCHNLEF